MTRNRCRFTIALILSAISPVGCVAAPDPDTSGSAKWGITVRVVDSEGKPVDDFDALLWNTHYYSSTLTRQEATGGMVRFDTKTVIPGPGAVKMPARQITSTSNPLELIVRSNKRGVALLGLPEPQREEEVTTTVVLSKPHRVEMTLKPWDTSVPVPSRLHAQIFLPHQTPLIMQGLRQGEEQTTPAEAFSLSPITMDPPGQLAFDLPPDLGSKPFFLLINQPGFLQGYISKPIRLDTVKDGKITLELPKPVQVSARLTAPPGKPLPDRTTVTLALKSYWAPPDVRMYYGYTLAQHRWQTPVGPEPMTLQVTDAAPHHYTLSASVGNTQQWPRPKGEYPFESDTRLELEAGESTGPIEIVYEPFDKSRYQGDYTAVVRLSRFDGSPLEKPTSYTLQLHDEKYGWITPAEGVTPASGPLTITGLPGGEKATTMTLEVGGERAGRVALPGTQKRQEFEFKLPPAEGDKAPDIQMTDVLTSRPMRLSDYKGQVVLVDFWATWCGPCQEPMAHNQEIMARRAADWKGKAVLLGCSVDNEMGLVTDHVKKAGWTSLPQGWCSAGKGGWESPDAKAYGITGVPTALLIGADGTILKRGHPAGFEIEKLIDEQLAKGRN